MRSLKFLMKLGIDKIDCRDLNGFLSKSFRMTYHYLVFCRVDNLGTGVNTIARCCLDVCDALLNDCQRGLNAGITIFLPAIDTLFCNMGSRLDLLQH